MGILHRRHLRQKTLHALYANYQNDNGESVGLKNVKASLEKVYEMYILLLRLLADLKVLAEERAVTQKAEKKTLGTAKLPEEIFAENKVLIALEQSADLQAKVAALKLDWFRDDPEIVDKIFRTFARTEDYKTYIQDRDESFKMDLKLVLKIFRQYVVNSEGLQKTIEDKSIYWTDDLDLVSIHVIKTLESINPEDLTLSLIPLYKDFDDDNAFVRKVFSNTKRNFEEWEEIIEKHAKNWEVERIALMDRLIMGMALTEFCDFPEIPVKVSLNEYIDLAKEYSTNKSKNFVNGILDKAINNLKEEGRISKSGRGLIE